MISLPSVSYSPTLAGFYLRLAASARTITEASTSATALTSPCKTASVRSSLIPLRSGIFSPINLASGWLSPMEIAMDSSVRSRCWVLSLIPLLPAGAVGPPFPRISLTLSKPATVITYPDAASAGEMYFWSTRYLVAISHSVDSGSRSTLGAAPSPGSPGSPIGTSSVSFPPDRSEKAPRSRIAFSSTPLVAKIPPLRTSAFSSSASSPTESALIAFDRAPSQYPTLAPPNPRSADLGEADLRGAKLRDADRSRANLSGVLRGPIQDPANGLRRISNSRTSENSVIAKFGEFTFYALEGIRAERGDRSAPIPSFVRSRGGCDPYERACSVVVRRRAP